MSDQPHAGREDEGTTVAEAARMLGITQGAVRKRVERGKLAAEHAPDGRLVVYLGATTTDTTHDTTHDRPRQSRGDRYTRSLEEQVTYLRSQLDQERDANRENRRIIAALTSRIPELEASKASDEREAAETVEEAPEGTDPHSAAGEDHDELGAERARREVAETTLHEGMAEERQRREAAERERDELRRELFGRRERTDAPETVEEAPDRAEEPHSATAGAQEPLEPFEGRGSGTGRGSLWRRIFGR